MEPHPASAPRRPPGVWLVSLGVGAAALGNAAVPLLGMGLVARFAPDAGTPLGMNLGAILLAPLASSLLALWAAVALFRLQSAALTLFVALLVLHFLTAVWRLAVTDLLELLGPVALLPPAFGLGLIGLAALYAGWLRRQGVLRG